MHLGSQLPLLVRGLYYDLWHAPGCMDEKPRTLDAFLSPLSGQLARTRPVNARNATQAVFRILSRHVNPGQIEKVKHALPGEVQTIWIEVTPDTQVEVERAIRRRDYAAPGAPEGGLSVCAGREGMIALTPAAAGLVAGVIILLRLKQLQAD